MEKSKPIKVHFSKKMEKDMKWVDSRQIAHIIFMFFPLLVLFVYKFLNSENMNIDEETLICYTSMVQIYLLLVLYFDVTFMTPEQKKMTDPFIIKLLKKWNSVFMYSIMFASWIGICSLVWINRMPNEITRDNSPARSHFDYVIGMCIIMMFIMEATLHNPFQNEKKIFKNVIGITLIYMICVFGIFLYRYNGRFSSDIMSDIELKYLITFFVLTYFFIFSIYLSASTANWFSREIIKNTTTKYLKSIQINIVEEKDENEAVETQIFNLKK